MTSQLLRSRPRVAVWRYKTRSRLRAKIKNLCKDCSIADKRRRLEFSLAATERKIYEARCCREEAIVLPRKLCEGPDRTVSGHGDIKTLSLVVLACGFKRSQVIQKLFA